MDVDMIAAGERIRAARARAGLTQRAVQAKTGVSQSTLHRIEAGKPTTVTLADFDRLAQALNVGLDELLYGSAVAERVLAAARSGTCSEDALRSGLEQAIELLKLDDRLDAVVPGLRQKALSRLAANTVGSPSERGRAAAEEARAVLGLGTAPVADVAAVTEHLTGVDVGVAPLPDGLSGICATDPVRETTVVLVNSGEVAERQRFTLAHELGHLLFGDKTHIDKIDGTRTPQEMTCDEFARHLLIPEDGVLAWLADVTDSADRPVDDERVMALLARNFGTSPDVTRIQLDRMGLLRGGLATARLPGGRRWAYRYGWGPQFDTDQAAAAEQRMPRRIMDRAIEAYRVGKLGVGLLARLQDRPVAQVEQALAEAGVSPRPVVRRADISALVSRAAKPREIPGLASS